MTHSFRNVFAAVAICLSAALPALAQTATRLTATKANDYGLVYSLPSTRLSVTLEAEITVQEPGEFYKYAKKYLNISNPIVKPRRTAKLLSAVIGSYGVADPERRYSVQFKSGSTPYMTLSANNVPLAVNTESVAEAKPQELPVAREAAPTPLQTSAARQVVSEEMMQSQSTAKRAELAAAAIFSIRQTRSELIAGEAEQTPPDGKSLQLMLDNLEAQEQALMAMFVGTTSSYTDVATFNIVPPEGNKRYVIARLSAIDGFVDADDLSGAPVYIDYTVVSRGETPVNEKGVELPFPKNGMAYCIPGTAEVSVEYDGRTFGKKRLEIAQLGIDYGISPNLLTDKKAPIYLIFDPATGAIIRQGVM